ncbi:MAG: hypothetical protein J6Y28_03905 [Acholeplasmatales bacterium]|nr:hypothetical protein [Acholeplasmatales bacterium]
MEIRKDKRYFGIYLTCVILATILSILTIIFLIYIAKQDDVIWPAFIVPVFAIIGDLFAYNSFIGYVKTPDLILKIEEDEITFTPDREKKLVTLKISEIKGVQVVRPLICRSGKTIILNTETNKYKLEDISNIDEAYNMLVDKIKG